MPGDRTSNHKLVLKCQEVSGSVEAACGLGLADAGPPEV